MPFPILLVAGAAAVGWGTGKLAEMKGNSLRREAEALIDGATHYVKDCVASYEHIRKSVAIAVDAITTGMIERKLVDNSPGLVGGLETLPHVPERILESWKALQQANITLPGSARFSFTPSKDRDYRIQGIMQTGRQQYLKGNELLGAAFEAMALAAKGVEHYAACRNYLSAAQAHKAATCIQAHELVESAKRESVAFVSDLSGLVVMLEEDHVDNTVWRAMFNDLSQLQRDSFNVIRD